MNLLTNYSLKSEFIYVLAGVVFGILIVNSTYTSVFFTLALYVLLLLLISTNPLKLLSFFIMMLPFSKSSMFEDNLINLPGTKPLNLLALFVIIIALINYKKSIKMPRYSFIFTILFLTIFSISFIHSLPNLDMINFFREDKLSPLRFFLSSFIMPLIIFMPFVIIIKFSNKIDQIEHITKMLYVSIVIFSFCILYLILGFPDRGNMTEITNYYILTVGLHKNGIADFLIVGFPIVLLRFFLKKNFFSILSIGLTVVVIAFTYSRAAYFITIFSFIFYLIISKRKKFLPAFLVIAFGLIFMISSSSIIERAAKGLQSQDAEEITAGRVEGIWLPLIDEYVENPRKLLFGNGRYALITSDAVAKGFVPPFSHPHNMYLELILDAGLLGFITLMPFFIILINKAYKSLNKIQDPKIKEYQYAVIVSLISFFISGLVGRPFFPVTETSYFWCILGIEIAILNILQKSGEYVNAET